MERLQAKKTEYVGEIGEDKKLGFWPVLLPAGNAFTIRILFRNRARLACSPKEEKRVSRTNIF